MAGLIDTLIAFGILAVVFVPLERVWAAHKRRLLRREWGTDVAFFAGQHLLWTAPVVAFLTWLHGSLGDELLGGVRAGFAELPFWMQAAVVILSCDVLIYWGHRLSHEVPFLWRFHRVHHTAERVDWLAAYREHPFDNLYTRTIENLPAILLGFPLPALAGFVMFRGLWALYIHSNVVISPGPLRYLLGSSRLHHWHHDRDVGGRVNFANLSPLMDILFGTFHDPGRMPKEYGIREKVRTGYVWQLVDPLVPTRNRR